MKKICTGCKKEKLIEEFSWKIKKKNIRHAKCVECKRKIDCAYYISSNKRKNKIRKRAIHSYEFLKLYVQRLKKLGKCKICGDKRWYVLDFHHLHDKEDGVNYMLRKGSINKIKNEIRKCILLCSNCHRELHHNERNGIQANLVEANV